ncbi:3-oxoacyl-[acyl-carrier-protein] synthase-3 [Desulfobaculum xiamenense]|uniref:Beta-ketoacyl-[acyl-carrier-protein] synthase III n=1 Tax=Desulfobaculum xiamenense TaxID=995050 RepID=A0A846QJE0_9BACT|nr:beta-ketoacyl-ACP synthase III [Desulfobaculum xiamenense]NJB68986.1 3-oxoacyl-[acyl-carrier-protein] synthase-3 [Desulfobaculum xiamenense]
MTTKAYIHGLGFHVPEKVLTNADMERIVETSDEWITSRTGIRARHVAAEGECASDLGAVASRKALASAGVAPEELTHIICGTCTPDSYCPNTATRLEHKIGASGCMAFDISAACSGFLYSLQAGRAMLALEPSAKVLVCAVEVMTSRVNWGDRTTCVLFGDGSGAAVLTSEKGENGVELVDALLESDGQYGDLLTISGGGSAVPYKLGDTVGESHFIQMQGREVFKVAVRSMVSACERLLEKNSMTIADVDWLVPHQANSRIIEAVGKKLEIPTERVFVNVDRYGNTSAASVGIALAEGVQNGDIRPGQTVLVTTFGGGFTWGAFLLRF